MNYNDIYASVKLPLAFTEEENITYLERSKAGDKEARNILLEHNLRLVVSIAQKYDDDEVEDLVSIGTFGLLKAITTFNLDYKSKFSNYAGKCIENEILMYFRKKNRNSSKVTNLEEVINKDEDGNELLLINTLFADNPTNEEYVEDDETREELLESFFVLSDLERTVIEKRYGFACEPMTQVEVAKVLKLSQSYVSRLERSAIFKIREFMRLKEFSIKEEKGQTRVLTRD